MKHTHQRIAEQAEKIVALSKQLDRTEGNSEVRSEFEAELTILTRIIKNTNAKVFGPVSDEWQEEQQRLADQEEDERYRAAEEAQDADLAAVMNRQEKTP